MTPGRPDPRPTGFGPLSWLWWAVLWAGWGLAAVVMGAEAVARAAQEPGNGSPGAGSTPRAPKPRDHRTSLYGAAIAIVIIQPLAACQPLSGGFDTAAGGPAMTAAAAPTTTVPSPFFCPGPAPSPAPPAPRGEPSPP